MKIAILHPCIDNVGGAEKVALILARELNANIYTTNLNKEAIIKMGFSDLISRIHSIGKVSLKIPLKQLGILFRFRRLNLKNYDCFILNGDLVLSSVINNQPTIYYANNAPCREVFDLNRFIRKNMKYFYIKLIFYIWTLFIRYLFKKYMNKCKKIIVNSNHVKKEFFKYIGKETIVIYPPIDTKIYKYKKNKAFWLCVTRRSPHKRLELVISAFKNLSKERLKIICWGENTLSDNEYIKKLEEMKSSNVELLNSLEKNELLSLYSECKGLLTTTIREDFGLVPVEAMASGKPVIAPNEGGYKETIIDGKTGILIENINEYKLIEAIKKLGKEIDKNPLKFKKACQKQAKKFDTEIFIEKIKNEIK